MRRGWGVRGGLMAVLALAGGASTALAAPTTASPPSTAVPSAAPLEGGAPAEEQTPLELDGVSFQGQTRGQLPGPDPGRPRLQPLVLLSAADGVGVGGQLRSGVFGVRGSVAYKPLLFLVDADPVDEKFGSYHVANSIQLNVDAMLLGVESDRGGSIGYRFNDVLGHGVTLAYQSRFEVWGQRFSLSLPVTYYPAATERVHDRLGINRDHAINFPFGPGLQYGVGAAWVF